MPSTTIHFPPQTLDRIDVVAHRRGISRNKFVIQACEAAVASDSGQWPEGFFELELGADNRHLLNEAGMELEEAVLRRRSNRGVLFF
jgi:hypothetical protein